MKHLEGSASTETGCVEQQCAHYGLSYPNQGKHPYSTYFFIPGKKYSSQQQQQQKHQQLQQQRQQRWDQQQQQHDSNTDHHTLPTQRCNNHVTHTWMLPAHVSVQLWRTEPTATLSHQPIHIWRWIFLFITFSYIFPPICLVYVVANFDITWFLDLMINSRGKSLLKILLFQKEIQKNPEKPQKFP